MSLRSSLHRSSLLALSLSTHSVAVDADGRAWSWGNGEKRRLGREEGRCNVPRRVEVGKDTVIRDVAAGLSHTVCCDDRGRVWTWGCAANGRLGNGASDRARPVVVDGVEGVRRVGAGAFHSLAVGGEGCWSWGKGGAGQLGWGDGEDQGR